MKSMITFLIIMIFGIVPFGLVVIRVLYKRNIVAKVATLIFLFSMVTATIGFAVGTIGLIALSWAIPLALVLLVGANSVTERIIQKPILKLKAHLDKMAVGEIEPMKDSATAHKDEIGDMCKSFNIVAENLHNTAQFAEAITNNNFDYEYDKNGENDELSIALINMRDELRNAKIAEAERAKEQEKAAWAASGVAEFSDLFRQENSNLEALSRVFISKLTDYTGVVQGGVFILNEDDPEHVKFELQGAVAYNRVKHMEKEFELGIGLVGQCAYEKDIIYLNEIPDNYMEITSGLGEANPRFVLLTPAILNDKVYAVIELASFTKIDDYKVDFVKKIGEALASTLSMVKINMSTARLLEESKEKADQLAEQSEALKQNYEELQATQEDLVRKEAELNELARRLKNGEQTDL